MNERIKLLAEQAKKNEPFECSYTKDQWLEKFAELIVKECAGITLDYKNDQHYQGWVDHQAEILKHFGVEE